MTKLISWRRLCTWRLSTILQTKHLEEAPDLLSVSRFDWDVQRPLLGNSVLWCLTTCTYARDRRLSLSRYVLFLVTRKGAKAQTSSYTLKQPKKWNSTWTTIIYHNHSQLVGGFDMFQSFRKVSEINWDHHTEVGMENQTTWWNHQSISKTWTCLRALDQEKKQIT